MADQPVVCTIFWIVVRPASFGRLISRNLKILFSNSSSNNSLVVYWLKEYSQAWHSWSEGCLSSFFGLGTFWYDTCAAIWAAVGGTFFTGPGFVTYGFFYDDEMFIRAFSREAITTESNQAAFSPLFLALFLRLFSWISMLCAFVYRLLNPSNFCDMSDMERSCQKFWGTLAPVLTKWIFCWYKVRPLYVQWSRLCHLSFAWS